MIALHCIALHCIAFIHSFIHPSIITMSSTEHVNKKRKNGAEAKESEDGVRMLNNFINGKFATPASGEYMPVESPGNGKLIGQVCVSNAADVDAAVAAAKAAFPAWSGQTVKTRVKCLRKFHLLMEEHEDELADLIVLEHGKNKAEALGDVRKGNETVEWALGMQQMIQGKILEVSRGVTCREVRRPLGVVASVVPFNFPAMVPMWTCPIAVATGNCMIIKPSEKVPLTMNRMIQLMHEAGVPPGVVQIVNGTAAAVNALIDHKDVNGVTFVGSTRVAEIVAKRARNINKRVLALGGAKNHLVTMPDCNVEMAAEDIVNSFTGCSGQRCMAASALLVVGQQDKLLERIVAKASERKPGSQGARDIGPIIDRASLDRILRYIDEAEKSGAKLLLDGRHWAKERKEGYWCGPTIILHSNPNDPAMRDEIFGPVLSVYVVADKEEAIKIENSNPYGNAAAVYTSTGENAEWFAKRFRAGMLGVNIGVPVPREPFSFGGIQASKFGDFDVTGEGSMNFFTQLIKVTQKWVPPPEKSWMS
eukprot:TRINITY_DN67928_c5_g13_i1.p1 TRINITY_DN67928_c5_g13~~TRINITY_DN67928_c5_g13_i1.p1  ORF type:complete len:535 (-),score=320.45 TRINITY_DN67928_c5_g13_i1:136-1740(-)